jgi:hypothetical protein
LSQADPSNPKAQQSKGPALQRPSNPKAQQFKGPTFQKPSKQKAHQSKVQTGIISCEGRAISCGSIGLEEHIVLTCTSIRFFSEIFSFLIDNMSADQHQQRSSTPVCPTNLGLEENDVLTCTSIRFFSETFSFLIDNMSAEPMLGAA